MAVQFDPDLSTATVLGFVPAIAHCEVPLTQFQPLGKLLDHLHQIQSLELRQVPVQLGRWLQNVIEAGWQTIEDLLAPEQLALGYRGPALLHFESKALSSVVRGKSFDLKPQTRSGQVALS